MMEFDPFNLNCRVLSLIPDDNPNIVMSANTYINLKNSLMSAQTKDSEPEENHENEKSDVKSE